MKKLLITTLVLSFLMALLPTPGANAGELSKIMGVTLSGTYDGVRNMYVRNGRTIAQYNDVANRGVPTTLGSEVVPLVRQHHYRDCDQFELDCFYL